jgi:hypothetical protein
LDFQTIIEIRTEDEGWQQNYAAGIFSA